MRIAAEDIRELHFLKYYRVVRKWACARHGLKDADIELLIYLDCIELFTLEDFKKGTYIYTWDKKRWQRLRKEGWIDVWRERDRRSKKTTIFKLSFKAKQLIIKIHKILIGEDEIPIKEMSPYYKNLTYTDKVFNKAIHDMRLDNDRARKDKDYK